MLLEFSLLTLKLASKGLRASDENVPVFFKSDLLVHFFLIHNISEPQLKQVVHISNWFELKINFRLLASDFLESAHDTTKGVNVLDFFTDLKLDLLDLISEFFKLVLSLDVQILGESILPNFNKSLEALLDVFSLKRKSTDDMVAGDGVNFLNKLLKAAELFFVVFKLRVVLVESSKLISRLLLPEPVELVKTIEELVDRGLGSLDRTSKKKDNLNDFFVLGNPSIEWLTLILRLVLLVPVLHLLGRLKNVTSGHVDSSLYFLKGRFEDASVTLKVNINLEEGLGGDLLGRATVATAADTLLHLVKRVLCGVEEGLVHRPVVVLGQFLDFFSRNSFDMLIKLVRANGLNQILNSSFNLLVLGDKFLRLNRDPVLLHLNKLLKSVSVGILGQVNEHGLGESLKVVLNTVFHDVVDIDNKLLQLGKTLMNVVQVAINVHGSPGKSDHTWSQLVFKILKVRNEKTLSVGANLVDNAVVFLENKLKFVVVHLEFIFLKKNNLSTLRNINTNT